MGFRDTYSVPGAPLIHRPVGQELAAGLTVLHGAPVTVRITIAGAYRWKLRGKGNHDGTISVAYARPGGGPAYDDGNPSDIAVTADTEFEGHDDDLYGEADLLITWTPTATNTVIAYLDIMALASAG